MVEKSKPSVYFFFKGINLGLKNRKKLKDFIILLFKKEGKKIEQLNYIFCNDRYLLEINKKYLGHNFYTDIITFKLSEGKKPIIADIYISKERVWDNAHLLEKTFQTELHRVIFHGALHLCNYYDKGSRQKLKMIRKEDHYLRKYFS